uniref:Carbohydratebinding protein putative n=1 Tax=Albugo laibachii Nc14 TaxID=890382 RepID=F0WL94_9STRA|nr:carbohydratebinding protein putative [Albugo laibachii Nc14]|eukprot:CCA22056.1 carbohydratebinding protein putative [Albugo laibachii Nc14]
MRKLFCQTFLVYLSTDAHDVSVCRDATYFIPDHRGTICAGSGSQPSGKECPIKGDIAVESCRMEMVTFLKDNKTCVAKENAVCDIVRGSTWGCIFPSVGCKPTDIVAECPAWTLTGTDWINPNFSKPIQEQPQVIPEELTQANWFTQETPVSDLTSGCEIIRIPAITPRPMKRIPSIQTGDSDPTLISTMSSSEGKSRSGATTIVATVAIAATVIAAAAGIAALVRYRLARKPALENGYRMDLVLTPR